MSGTTQVTINPVLAWWILAPAAMAAGMLVVYLYREQRKIASRWAVGVLTGLRVALIVLLALLLLRPAMQYTSEKKTSGTLWIVSDHSGSMQATDPQASAMEKMRWADALGYLSASTRDGRPDLMAAHVAALEGSWPSLRPQLSRGVSATERDEVLQAREIDRLAERLNAWAKQADEVAKLLQRDGVMSRDGKGVTEKVERVAGLVRAGVAEARKKKTLREAAEAVNWPTVQTNLTLATREAWTIADAVDAALVRAKGSDSSLSAGMARVTKVPRTQLAWLGATATENREKPLFRDLPGKYRTRLAGFADSAQAAGTVDAGSFAEVLKQTLSPAGTGGGSGAATSIAAGLQLAAEQIGPEEPASVIVISDGRQNLPIDPAETARLLAARGVRVYGIVVGSGQVSPDAAVEQIDAPEWIFREDTLTAKALIRLDGLQGQRLKVELLRGGTVVGTQTVATSSAQGAETVTFTDKPPEGTGAYEYEVRVAEAVGESNVGNNRQSFRVAIRKDKLLAIYVEDRPRWEFRYVSSFLERDARLKVQTVMLNPAVIAGVTPPAPVRASPTNPRLEAQELPQTLEEWQAFDLIIIGDVAAANFSAEQQQFIAAAVRDKGATLITIAGQRHMPEEYANLPLSELFPVTGQAQFAPEMLVRHSREGVRVTLAPEGSVSVLGQLGLDSAANAEAWANVPTWYWHSAYTQAKPSASVIWTFGELERGGGDAEGGAESMAAARRRAMLASMNVGLGKTLHLASDQTWRLRQVGGQNLQDRFWGQVVRWAVGSDLPAGGKFVRFGTSRPRYTQGEPVTVTARILREDLTPYSGLAVSATAKVAGASDGRVVAEARLVETPEAPGYYRGTIGGLPAGDLEIGLRGGAGGAGDEIARLLEGDPTVTQRTVVIKVVPQLNVEQRNTNTDRAMLERIAAAGGGFVVNGPYADVLAAHLPVIEQTQTVTQQIGFFTDPNDRGTHYAHWFFFGLFALLLTVEWAIRKRAGLL